ncbi:3,4-dioxygenase subunit beta [Kocuria marina]|uniref:dioxygenase family protein n=1 Tax=Kocuria marina TaxID=223184 RepID=UPI001EE4554D|nr:MULTISPECIES: 3,4-dioxygenase subunit beta [Kocuria]MCT1615974.1 3,4-dioxygenase subunit beta [Kocuria marina]
MNPIRRRRSIRTYPATSETCAMQSQSTDRAHAGRRHPGHRDTGDPGTGHPHDEGHDASGTLPAAAAGTFEGRVLDRPHEDVADQGLAFDLGTLLNRRRALGILGAGSGVMLLAACGGNSTAGSQGGATSSTPASASPSPTATRTYSTEMPQETAGPYPGDGSNGQDVLEVSGVERRDITTSIGGGAAVDGVAMTLTMNIVDMVKDNRPMTGAAVYVWHCDPDGNYSMYSDGVTQETYLRGVQVVGKDGTVTFTSVVPGCYAGRWPHIHFEVFPDIGSITDAGNAVLTSQIAIPQAMATAVYKDSRYPDSAANMSRVSLTSDNVFSDGTDMQLPRVTGGVSGGYTLTIDVPVDTSTAPQNAAAPGGGAGPGAAGGGGAPGQ